MGSRSVFENEIVICSTIITSHSSQVATERELGFWWKLLVLSLYNRRVWIRISGDHLLLTLVYD